MKLSTLITFAIFGLTSAQYGCDITTVICEHNRYRAAKGLKPLGVHTGLLKSALAHSKAMASVRDMTHRASGESNLMQRIKGQQVSTSGVGENIAEGYSDEKKVCTDWYNDPGHYANIMNPTYNCAGVANVAGYWTVDFAVSQCAPVNCNGGNNPSYDENVAPIEEKPTYVKPIDEVHTYVKPTYVKPTYVKPIDVVHTYIKPTYVKPTAEYIAPHSYEAPIYDAVAPTSEENYPAAPSYNAVEPTSDYVRKKCRQRGNYQRTSIYTVPQ